MANLDNMRQLIDEIDDQIMDLLEKRFQIVDDVTSYKKETKTAILDIKREQTIIDKTFNYSHFPQIGVIYKCILKESKAMQRK